jgi:hypothetical protein
VQNTVLRMIEAESADEDLEVDVVGTEVDGVTEWDFLGELPDDVAIELEAVPVDNTMWFADKVADLEIPDGGVVYVSKLSSTTWGVFRRTDTQLLIHAVAAVEEDSTFIAYDPPITALAYPLEVGTEFGSESTGSGVFDGDFGVLTYCSTDTYESEVTDRGVVATPAGDYDVLRVDTTQTVVVDNCFGFPLTTVTHKQVVFMTACTGAVVSVTSAEGADDFSFDVASRVRRVGL